MQTILSLRVQVNVIVATLLFCSSAVFCEPRLGRLADGRAYRTDAAGIEMVDHLAELELTVEELKTRVHGLEYELEEKTNVISALKGSGAREPRLQEIDLLAGQPQARIDTTVDDQSDSLVRGNNNLVQEMKLKEEELAALNNQVASCRSDLVKLNATSDQDQQDQLEEMRTAFFKEQEKARQSDKVLQNLTRDFELLKDQRDQLILALRDRDAVQAANQKVEQSRPAVEARAALRTDTLKNADDVRSDLRTSFSRVRGMKIERDRRYRLYRMGLDSHQKTARMQELRTRNGSNLDNLEKRIEQINSESEARAVRSELNEIRSMIEQDVKLLGRLAN